MKALKWILGSVVIVIAAITIYITQFFNLNDFKPQIVDAVKEQTGRDFQITDDLSWSFFPSIGINLGGIALSNPESFNPASMVKVNKVVANVALMPLLSQEIEVSELVLDGLTVNLVTKANGASSFDGLTGGNTETTQENTATSEANKVDLASLYIGGINVTNTQINLIDEATQSKQTFTLENLTLGEFSPGTQTSFSYRFLASLPDLEAESAGEGSLTVANDMKSVTVKDFTITNLVTGEGIPNKSIKNTLVTDMSIDTVASNLAIVIKDLTVADIKATGDIKVNYAAKVPRIDLGLDFGEINLDPYIAGEPESGTNAEKGQQTADNTAMQEPDLSGLQAVELDLRLTAKAVKANNLNTQNWNMAMSIRNGILTLSKLTADMYEGQLNTTASLDGTRAVASYKFNSEISGVQFRPLLTDAAEVDFLSGTAVVSVKGQGSSLIPEKLKQKLQANGKFEIADGSLYGVNIPQMIRGAQKKLQGDLSAADTEELKTDFTSLTGSFNLKEGLLTNPDLAMASPLLRINGAGSAHIISQVLDYKLSTSVVGSLSGQGDATDDALAGIDIPLSITGTMAEPEFGLDTEALFDAKLKQETDKVKDKLKDSLLEKFGGF